MRKVYYLPYNDKKRVVWFMNFITVFPSVAVNLGFSLAEVEALKNDYIVCKYMNEILELFKNEMQERTKYKDLLYNGKAGIPMGNLPSMPSLPTTPIPVASGVFKRLNKIVQRIKNHTNYNEAIGKNLGIIGAEKVIDLNTIKPKVRLKASTPDSISLRFFKNRMDGVVIYGGTPIRYIVEAGKNAPSNSETEIEMNWIEIIKLNHSPFIDTRANSSNKPETRYYKIRYFKKDVLVGQDSDIISVISTIPKD